MKRLIPLTILILVGAQALAQDQIIPNRDQPIPVVVELVDGEQIEGFIHSPSTNSTYEHMNVCDPVVVQ